MIAELASWCAINAGFNQCDCAGPGTQKCPMIEILTNFIFEFVLSEVWWDKGACAGALEPGFCVVPSSTVFLGQVLGLSGPLELPWGFSLPLPDHTAWPMLPQGGLGLCCPTLRAGPGMHWPAPGWQRHSTLGRHWAAASHPPNQIGTASLQEIAVTYGHGRERLTSCLRPRSLPHVVGTVIIPYL